MKHGDAAASGQDGGEGAEEREEESEAKAKHGPMVRLERWLERAIVAASVTAVLDEPS